MRLVLLLATVSLQLLVKLGLLQAVLLGGEAQPLLLLQLDRLGVEIVLDLLGKGTQLISVLQMLILDGLDNAITDG